MNFTKASMPYILQKLSAAHKSFSNNDTKVGFKALEDAHVIGQYSTYHHTRVHYEMLKFGITKTPIGLLPEGNTGGANVSPFKPMPISPENKAILEKIKNAQS